MLFLFKKPRTKRSQWDGNRRHFKQWNLNFQNGKFASSSQEAVEESLLKTVCGHSFYQCNLVQDSNISHIFLSSFWKPTLVTISKEGSDFIYFQWFNKGITSVFVFLMGNPTQISWIEFNQMYIQANGDLMRWIYIVCFI